jgi:hypothetical protein
VGDRPSLPRITFGIIVLNGEPFTRYNLRSLYQFAHQIIVVEGASPHAGAVASADGHSTDGTLDSLRRFRAEEDPDDKVQILTAEQCGHPSGFWPGEKDEQSRAFASRATGDWLWQVDIDEFYRPGDVRAVMQLLSRRPETTAVSFENRIFWGSTDVVVDGLYLRAGAGEFHRLFRFGPGYSYVTHRPPTILDAGGRDLRTVAWVRGSELARQGIYLYHYAMLFPKQVREKCSYYARAFDARDRALPEWAEHVYFRLERPFGVHHTSPRPSWLERFRGEHPAEIRQMIEDIHGGRIAIELRRTDDIDALLASPAYAFRRAMLKAYSRTPLARPAPRGIRRVREIARIPLGGLAAIAWRKLRSLLTLPGRGGS